MCCAVLICAIEVWKSFIIFSFLPSDQHVIAKATKIFPSTIGSKNKKEIERKADEEKQRKKLGEFQSLCKWKTRKARKFPKIRYESAIRAVYSEMSCLESSLVPVDETKFYVHFISAWGSSSNHTHIHFPSSQSRRHARDELVLIILYTFPASTSTSVSHNPLSL